MAASIIPYLYYGDPGSALDFMQEAFGFEIEVAFRDPNSNEVLHASVNTGSGTLFMGPGMVEFGTHGTPDADFVTSMTYVYVDDVNHHYEKAIKAGAVLREELHDHFGGNRQYTVSDPGGQRWTFAQPLKVNGEQEDAI